MNRFIYFIKVLTQCSVLYYIRKKVFVEEIFAGLEPSHEKMVRFEPWFEHIYD